MSFLPIFKGPLVGGWLFTKTFVKTQSRQTKQISEFFQAVSDHIWRLPSFGDRYIDVAIAPKSENSKLANQHLPHGTHLLNKKNLAGIALILENDVVPFKPLWCLEILNKKPQRPWHCAGSAVAEVVAEGGPWRSTSKTHWRWSRQNHPMAWWQTKGREGMVESKKWLQKNNRFCQLGNKRKWDANWEVVNRCGIFCFGVKMGKSLCRANRDKKTLPTLNHRRTRSQFLHLITSLPSEEWTMEMSHLNQP